MKKLLFAAITGMVVLGDACAKDPIDEVNTKIGTISHMLVPVFPVIQRPNAMMRMTPANTSMVADRIPGFALAVPAHRQGEVFMMMPASGAFESLTPSWSARWDHSEVLPYRYSVYLDDQEATVEFAPAEKSAIYRVTYENAAQPRYVLLRPRQNGALSWDGKALSGFDVYHKMKVWFWMEFDAAPVRVGAFEGDKPVFGKHTTDNSNKPVAVEFAPSVKAVSMRYGISFVSAEQARKNLAKDIKDFSLERLAKETRKAWNRVLDKIEVEGGTPDERAVFYSALYRCHERMINISEDGQYFSAWDSKVHADEGIAFWTDDWIWDTFRAQHPLMAILHPKAQGEKLTSFIRAYEQSGWVPTFPNVYGDAHCMNGQHAVATFIDAWRKGVRNFDLDKAFEGMKATMLGESIIPWYRGPATELDRFYWEKGFFPALHPGEAETVKEVVPGERRQAVAVTLAAAYDAWCLAEIANELGRKEDAAFFMKHAYDYRNLWNAKTGFFHPKDKDGNFIAPGTFDYKYAGGQGARDYYDENNGWTYIWEVYHNIGDLVNLFGGRKPFIEKLDQLFVEGPNRPIWEFYNVLPDSTGLTGMFVMGNEPSLHIPYLYNYVGEPWKTQKRVRMLLDAWWRNDTMGVCGDEDGGGLSAFAVLSMMGFYPATPGMPVYTLASPVFKKIEIEQDNGKTFTIKAPKASRENKYIQRVTINGKPWDKTWFTHDIITNGGTIVIELGPRPNKSWGTAPEAAPPSIGG